MFSLLDHPASRLGQRIAIAVLGGYALCWGCVEALSALLPFEKVTVWYLTGQLAPLPFAAVLLASFAVRSPGWLAVWVFGWAGGLILLGRLA